MPHRSARVPPSEARRNLCMVNAIQPRHTRLPNRRHNVMHTHQSKIPDGNLSEERAQCSDGDDI